MGGSKLPRPPKRIIELAVELGLTEYQMERMLRKIVNASWEDIEKCDTTPIYYYRDPRRGNFYKIYRNRRQRINEDDVRKGLFFILAKMGIEAREEALKATVDCGFVSDSMLKALEHVYLSARLNTLIEEEPPSDVFENYLAMLDKDERTFEEALELIEYLVKAIGKVFGEENLEKFKSLIEKKSKTLSKTERDRILKILGGQVMQVSHE